MLSPLAQGDTLNQVADRAALETRISKQGQVVTSAKYFVKNRGQPNFQLTLPPGTELWAATVNGVTAVPTLDGKAHLIPLPGRADPDAISVVELKLASRSAKPERVSVADLIRRAGVDLDDLEQAEALGLATVIRADGEPYISTGEAWLFDALGELRQLGFSKERGFTVKDVAFYHEAMTGLFRQEVGLLSSRLSHLQPSEAARMIERAMPIVNQTLSRLHTQLVREFFGDSF